MKIYDRVLLPLIGLAFWIIGTLWYEVRGPSVFETTSLRYRINFILAPIASAIVCIAILKWSHIPAREWAAAALLIALPGMVGEAVLLSRFAIFMPRMQAASAGRYGAFLFAAYALFLTISVIATLTATS
ncbi:MAG: DUF5367 family protein [Silvibacterium sp.]